MSVSPWSRCKTRFPISSTHFCGTSERGSSCIGDSGGPVIAKIKVNDKIIEELVGIVSFGSEHCDPTLGVAYTRVKDYVKWIRRKVCYNNSVEYNCLQNLSVKKNIPKVSYKFIKTVSKTQI